MSPDKITDLYRHALYIFAQCGHLQGKACIFIPGNFDRDCIRGPVNFEFYWLFDDPVSRKPLAHSVALPNAPHAKVGVDGLGRLGGLDVDLRAYLFSRGIRRQISRFHDNTVCSRPDNSAFSVGAIPHLFQLCALTAELPHTSAHLVFYDNFPFRRAQQLCADNRRVVIAIAVGRDRSGRGTKAGRSDQHRLVLGSFGNLYIINYQRIVIGERSKIAEGDPVVQGPSNIRFSKGGQGNGNGPPPVQLCPDRNRQVGAESRALPAGGWVIFARDGHHDFIISTFVCVAVIRKRQKDILLDRQFDAVTVKVFRETDPGNASFGQQGVSTVAVRNPAGEGHGVTGFRGRGVIRPASRLGLLKILLPQYRLNTASLESFTSPNRQSQHQQYAQNVSTLS